jgi:predicted Zn-dependent protease
MGRSGRDHLWAFLDTMDARPGLKKTLLIAVPAFALTLGFGIWGYRHWSRTHSIRIARQWLDAGRLDRASVAVQDALANEPDLPASWQLASELAWKMGNREASVDFAKKAAIFSRYQTDEVLAWAEASVLTDDPDQAQEAQEHLDPATALESPRALRIAGEIARRSRRFTDARDKFKAALDIDAGAGVQSLGVDQIPLGIVSLQTGSAGDRTRGRFLLSTLASDPGWGVDALRALLEDAEVHGDASAASRWAESLRMHPRCTLGDIPVCLKALADFDPARFQSALAQLEDKGRSSPTQSAQILGWLTQIGQAPEAIRWGRTLDPAASRKPPISQGIAEALRATGRWEDLQAWVAQGEWGGDMDFLGWAYRMAAARHLNDGPGADSLWQSLYADAHRNAAHALVLGDSFYAWGYPKEAAAFLWAAADRADLAYQAIGTLARLYQVQGDAAGQYQAFSRLNAMRPGDRRIANNFAYFAVISNLGSQQHVERIAEDNFTQEPDNVIYRSTYALVLAWSGQGSQALALMEPVSRDWKKSPAVAFAYGAALASAGRKSEAKDVFDALDPHGLDAEESDWIQAALR